MLKRKLAWILPFFFLISCARAGAGSGPLSTLASVTGVSSIDIHNDWMGLSEFGPVGRHFVLKPSSKGFEGTATFSLGGGDHMKTKDVPIVIPAESVRAFLELLASSPMHKGTYTPSITHTDDYPSVQIDVTSGNDRFTFFSTSQGDDAIPWGAVAGSEKYVVNAKNPMDAFRKLEPYFKEDEFQKFTEEVRKEMAKERRGR